MFYLNDWTVDCVLCCLLHDGDTWCIIILEHELQ